MKHGSELRLAHCVFLIDIHRGGRPCELASLHFYSYVEADCIR
jgi:hypothetical protein